MRLCTMPLCLCSLVLLSLPPRPSLQRSLTPCLSLSWVRQCPQGKDPSSLVTALFLQPLLIHVFFLSVLTLATNNCEYFVLDLLLLVALGLTQVKVDLRGRGWLLIRIPRTVTLPWLTCGIGADGKKGTGSSQGAHWGTQRLICTLSLPASIC